MAIKKQTNKGRPNNSKAEAYQRSLLDVVDIVTWKKIVAKAVEDALDDDAQTRARARGWLKEALIGRPAQAGVLPNDDVDLDMSDKTPDELQKLIDEFESTSTEVEKFLGGNE